METSTMPNILAWTMSQSVVTLLMSSTMEGYASFGSAFIRKNIETLFQFGVQHIYREYDNYRSTVQYVYHRILLISLCL